MRKRILPLLLVPALLIALLFALPTAAQQPDLTEKPVLLGEFEAKDINGEDVSYEILQNAPLTFVNVWGTFCPPCINEMPELAKLADEYAGQVQFLGIVGDINDALGYHEDLIPTAQDIVTQTGTTNYTHIIPSDAMNTRLLFGIQAFPTSFFLDTEGKQVGLGYEGSRTYDQWKSIIDETLSSKE